MGIRVSIEGPRGCGYRQPGGLYLVAPELSDACTRLPLPVESCPTCGAGVRPARGWTWIVPEELFGFVTHGTARHNLACPIGTPGLRAGRGAGARAGLLWVGEKYYPSASSFMDEAARMGVSRRISAVPRGFVTGETWVFLGHRKGLAWIEAGEEHVLPAIVTAFQPEAIEYVVKGDETEEELAALEERGLSLVQVVRDQSQTPIGFDEEE